VCAHQGTQTHGSNSSLTSLEFDHDSFRSEIAFDKAVYPSFDGHECGDNNGYGDKVKVFRRFKSNVQKEKAQ